LVTPAKLKIDSSEKNVAYTHSEPIVYVSKISQFLPFVNNPATTIVFLNYDRL
jgi:hypothetical protein